MYKALMKYLFIFIIMAGGVAGDLFSKKWAENNLKGKEGITLVHNYLDLGFAENRGMIFGILNGKMPGIAKVIVAIFRILILIGITALIYVYRKKSFLYLLPLMLFWAGALGNLIDPFIYGYVVDFIHIQIGSIFNWPFFFNLADAYVTVGMVLFLLNNSLLKDDRIPVKVQS